MKRGELIAIIGMVAGCGGGGTQGGAGGPHDLSAAVDAGTQHDLSVPDLSVGDRTIHCRFPIIMASNFICNDERCHTPEGMMTFIPPFDPFDPSTMVNVPAYENPRKLRVKPFDAANSFLWQKLAGLQNRDMGEGEKMPLIGGNSDAEIAAVKCWIDEGAP